MSFQRNNLHISDLGASTRQQFVQKSMAQPSPFSETSPIPPEIRSSINFLSYNSTDEIRSFWGRQLGHLKTLIATRSQRSTAWYANAPPELLKFHRRYPLDAWAALLDFCGIGGAKWLGQFAHGFPITGTLSQKFAYPVSEEKLPAQLSIGKVLQTAQSRFRSRSARPPPMAESLWAEAMEQVSEGWLDPPSLLNDDGQLADGSTSSLNISFRFAVSQSSKVRACDDLKDSLTNRLCSVETPIKLPDWDLLGAMSLLISSSSKKNWVLVKADDTSAYKNLPLRPSDSFLTAIALWNSAQKAWFAFLPRTLLFGATAAVLHYNVFSRILAAILNRLFGIPLISFYDDLGTPMIEELAPEALSLIIEVSRLLGVILNQKKCDLGNPLSFLGLLASFPQSPNDWKMSLCLTQEKIQKWSSQIEDFLSAGKISFADLQKLIGKLSFAQSTVFGKCARAFIRPLYAWLYSMHFSPLILPNIAVILQWWIRLLKSFRPRIVSCRPRYPEFIIFTDASYKDGKGMIAAFLFRREDFLKDGSVFAMASCEAPAYILRFFGDTLPIFALEFFVIALAIFEWKDILRYAAVTAYTDNTGAFGAVLNTGSSAASVSAVTMRLWYLIAHFQIWLWLEPVASPLNIADLPTRGKPSPFPVRSNTGFKSLEEAFFFFTQTSITEFMEFFTSPNSYEDQ